MSDTPVVGCQLNMPEGLPPDFWVALSSEMVNVVDEVSERRDESKDPFTRAFVVALLTTITAACWSATFDATGDKRYRDLAVEWNAGANTLMNRLRPLKEEELH